MSRTAAGNGASPHGPGVTAAPTTRRRRA